MNYPVYFLPFDNTDSEILGQTVKGLQQLPRLPWPGEKCIVLAENPLYSILDMEEEYQCRMYSILAFVKCGNVQNPRLEGEQEIDLLVTDLVDDKILQYQDRYWMYHVTDPNVRWMDTEESLDKRVAEIKSKHKLNDPKAEEKFRNYFRKIGPQGLTSFWTSCVGSRPNPTEVDLGQHGLAADMLVALANLAVPCGYMVKSSFKRGFGPTGRIKRQTKEMTIFSMIKFNRLYRTFVGGNDSHEVEPHHRRGHIRHLWKEAGLNRFSLPNDPVARIKLVHDHRVRRVVIPPTWIGEKRYETDDCDFEIITGETELGFL